MTMQNLFDVTSYWQIKQLAGRRFHFKLDTENKTTDELVEIWNELYEYYLFLLTRVDNVGFMEAENIIIKKDITIPTTKSIHFTPYYFDELKDDSPETAPPKMWNEFKQDIFERGSFFVFIIDIYDRRMFIRQGTHRLTAIRELIAEGRLPKDFKVLCIENEARDRDIINQVAVQLGRLENKLRKRHNVIMQPHVEMRDEKFFGYLHRIPIYTQCPNLDRRFKNEEFTPVYTLE